MAKQRLVENFILNPDSYQRKPLTEGQEEIFSDRREIRKEREL